MRSWNLTAAAASAVDNENRSSDSIAHCIVNTHLIRLDTKGEVECGESSHLSQADCVPVAFFFSVPHSSHRAEMMFILLRRMWLTLIYSCTGGAALLYALYRWVIPAAVQYHGGLALFWHDVVVERMLDTLTQSTRPQV